MYHPHYDEMTQMALGMVGMIVVHPKNPKGPRVDRDFALMTHEWALKLGARRPDPNEMKDFNVLTFNAKAFPGTAPLVVGKGERVRIRLGNLSAMDHHPIHFHGFSFEVVGTDGGEIPVSARQPETTVLVPTGSVRVIEFVPPEAGDWAMHCHMTHHIMNSNGPRDAGDCGRGRVEDRRGGAEARARLHDDGTNGDGRHGRHGNGRAEELDSDAGGMGPFSSIDMGGMFTILKVRDDPDAEDGSRWFQHPQGTVRATRTSPESEGGRVDPDVVFR